MMNRTDSRFQLLPVALAMGLAFLLAACQPTPPAATPSTSSGQGPTTSAQAPTVAPTNTPLPPTPTPTPTHTPLPPTATPTATPTNTPLPTAIPLSPSPLPPVSPSPLPPTDTPTPAADDAPMVRVPAGEFIMGSDMKELFTFQDRAREEYRKQYEGTHTIVTVSPRYFANELPRRTLYLDEFYIDQYEVTNARYRRCVEAGVCQSPLGGLPSSSAYDDHPALVTWAEAETYCRWAGKRLPTEVEWEKAARGTDGRIWPWGNEWEEGRANTFFSQQEGIAPVGSYPGDVSPYEAMDMAGNVREWVDDWYQPYGGSDFRSELFGEQRKVARGGTWDEVGMEARTAFRLPLEPDGTAVGFRCLKDGSKPTPEPMPTPRPTLTPDPRREMVYVPAGEFLMGKREDEIPDIERYDEVPQHKVYLDAFYMDKYEVTNAQYVTFLNEVGVYHGWACEGRPCVDVQSDNRYSRILYDPEEGQYAVEAGYEDHPVVTVSWYGAKAYCEYYGLRLPTEAEWEKAARGTDGRIWPWGDEPPDGSRANYCDTNCLSPTHEKDKEADDGYALTAPVGSYPAGASPYGVLDMAGNAEEWVSDWWKGHYYQYSPYRNPQGPLLSDKEGTLKVTRGGSYYTPPLLVRAGVRFSVSGPFWGREFSGFRCVRGAE